MLTSSFRYQWSGLGLLAAALTVLTLILADCRNGWPELAPFKHPPGLSPEAIPVTKLEALWSVTQYGRLIPATTRVSAFHTMYFQPPPPPKPPTTRKIDLIYQGFYQTSSGQKQAFVKVAEGVVVGAIGARVVGDWVVDEINLRRLILKNGAAQTNLFEFNTKKQVEVPMP